MDLFRRPWQQGTRAAQLSPSKLLDLAAEVQQLVDSDPPLVIRATLSELALCYTVFAADLDASNVFHLARSQISRCGEATAAEDEKSKMAYADGAEHLVPV